MGPARWVELSRVDVSARIPVHRPLDTSDISIEGSTLYPQGVFADCILILRKGGEPEPSKHLPNVVNDGRALGDSISHILIVSRSRVRNAHQRAGHPA